MMIGDNSHIAFKPIDLTGVQQFEFLVNVNQRNGAIEGSVEARLGSPTGELLGKSETGKKKDMGFRPPQGVNPLQCRRENSNRAKIKINPASGLQDIYFIFKNPAAKGEEVLMGITEIQFMNQVPVATEVAK